MTREDLKQEFNTVKGNFNAIRNEIEKEIRETKYSKCEYFEIFPYSYQRYSFKQGKLLENLDNIKSTEDIYIYGFDKNNRIIMVKEGISIQDNFNYDFLIYKEDIIKSMSFNNTEDLRNISYYFLNTNNQIKKMISQGRRGGRDELYIYSEVGLLEEIQIKQYDRRGNEVDPYKEIFEYSETRELKCITKNFENGYSEIIYEI